jgi:Copper type II ascorbate-dependent monooxygenase, C-terminal domain
MAYKRYAATAGFPAIGVALGSIALGGCGSEAAPSSEPTFWQDVAPIMAAKCVHCHQENGIGPFRLDDYGIAASRANAIDRATQSGHMPPFLVAHDGSCGDFQDEEALTPKELDTIHRWAGGKQAEGAHIDIPRPPLPTLAPATEYHTPLIVPVADSTNPLGSEDEYRCFPFEPGISSDRFITGYQVVPGNPAIVHHVSLYVVKPAAPSYLEGKSNQDLMTAYDAASPDRPGWDCFGAAGDGITLESFPVTWAAGQMVVEYPDGAGIAVAPTDRFVVQLHYNLHSRPSAGAADSTLIRLRYADTATRRALSLGHDPFLGTLFGADTPDMLPPGEKRAPYTWSNTREEMGLDPSLPPLQVLGILPHMHGRGRTYELHLRSGARDECIARVDDWDIHWQKVYWYKTPPILDSSASLQLTCTYDTQGAVAPILPGWGSANEMCMATALLALPPGQ